MNANDVLIDLLEDNRRRLHRVIGEMSDERLHWTPDPGANSIAVTVWHMGRLFDVFLTRQTNGDPVENECWFSHGWARKTGYDPRGIGRDGWGSVNGYTLEEVAAIPRFTGEQLLAYFDDVHDTVKAYLENTPMAELQTAGAGFDGRYTKYQCVQMALLDNARHLGEIFTLNAMGERCLVNERGGRGVRAANSPAHP
jgi:hypothetical protein